MFRGTAILILLGISPSTSRAETERIIHVTQQGPLVEEPLVQGDRAAATANTERIARILAHAPGGAGIYFPAGDYYFHGSAQPGRGTIETTAPGQIIYGDGPGLTRLIQLDRRRDFGFEWDPQYKHVPSATVRIRHKGSALRKLTVMLDPEFPIGIYPTAAIQIAHIQYRRDGHAAIIETTGRGVDFLVDHVLVRDVEVGRHEEGGIRGERFFQVGIDIIGSGGHVRVEDVHRLDARIGIRLDNGNHCGQGEYLFRNIHMIGRHGVTDGGVFFDWIGGQAPQLEMSSASFINGFRAGPLGLDGDRLEPFPEGEVHRAPDRDWDWLTWHGHSMPEFPTHAERIDWYGLPRHAEPVRAGTHPRVGGRRWLPGRHFRVERVTGPEGFEEAVKLHWLTEERPADGTVYYVTFTQPQEYRVHDLQWGNLLNCSFQEANQAGPGSYTLKFEDQNFGLANPDFHHRAGLGFSISNTFTINGDMIFDGRIDSVTIDATSAGVSNIHIRGRSPEHPITNMILLNNRFNSIEVGDHVVGLRIDGNDLIGQIRIQAPELADRVEITRNMLRGSSRHGIELDGHVRGFSVEGNHLVGGPGDGIVIRGAAQGIISGNRVRGVAGAALRLEECHDIVVTHNIFAQNGEGIVTDLEETDPRSHISGNIVVPGER
jgi:hypothetical protein